MVQVHLGPPSSQAYRAARGRNIPDSDSRSDSNAYATSPPRSLFILSRASQRLSSSTWV